jgi:antitoxin ParD1/3/4
LVAVPQGLARPDRTQRSNGWAEVGKICHICQDEADPRRKLPVPTRNISLTPEQDAFIEKAVKSGEYQNASEAVRDALRALQQRRREDALKLEALRMQIEAGVDALARGAFTEVADAELDRYLEGLTATLDEQVR